jgi:integrase
VRLTPSFEEFLAIIADIRAQAFNGEAPDSANFVEFIGLAGLGQAEAANLRRQDVNFKAGMMSVRRSKTSTAFAVPIYPQLRPLMERLCQGVNPRDRVFQIKDAKKAITGACRRLELPRYSHRSLRRMFITRAIERGVDVKVIADWQGHRDGGKLILDTYSHVRPVHSQRMAQLMTTDEPQNVVQMPATKAQNG